jgi:CO/xanthine dehydrogenase Mo-binding subunit
VSEDSSSLAAVGSSPPRRDGFDKVTGRARYLDDLRFPGQLWGRTIRSTVPRGRLQSITFDPSFDWTGITTVTAKDIPGENVINLIVDDQPCLVEREIRHAEEPLALLACEDRERLEEAMRHVQVEVEALPAVLDPLASATVFKEYLIEHGEGASSEAKAAARARVFASAHRVIAGRYAVGHQEQMYIEPNAVCAVPRGDGGVVLHGSLQCPFYVHRALQRLLKLPEEKIAVLQAVTGGGFGGKEDYPSIVASHAALLALKAKRPVKMIYQRDEDVAATTKRHPAILHYSTAVAEDGTFLACEIDVVMDGGAYVTLSPVVASRGVLHAAGAYRWPHARIACRVVQTNTPPNGAFRGFGVPQTMFGIEAHVERIAAALRIDPLELRRKNCFVLGDLTPTGQELKWSVSAREALDEAARMCGWEERRARFEAEAKRSPGARKRKGLGISLAHHGAGFTGSGEVKLRPRAGVELIPGGVRVLSIATDIGQGTITIFSQMAAEPLGLPLACIEVAPPDSSKMPDSGPTVASRTTMVVGGTIARAAQQLALALAAYCGGRHAAAPEEIECRAGVYFAGDRELESFDSLSRAWLAERGPLQIIELYKHPEGIAFDDQAYTGEAYPCFAWAGTAVELTVDQDTYEVTLDKVWCTADVGRAIHPVLAAGQVEGGTVQALGYALLEELLWKDGRIANTRMQNYLIPTALDAPPLETALLENPYPFGPFGAKGLGELPMDGPAPAVLAAVLHATGALVPELPISPERLMRACDALPAATPAALHNGGRS